MTRGARRSGRRCGRSPRRRRPRGRSGARAPRRRACRRRGSPSRRARRRRRSRTSGPAGRCARRAGRLTNSRRYSRSESSVFIAIANRRRRARAARTSSGVVSNVGGEGALGVHLADQRALAAAGAEVGERGRDRRLADAALAGDEQQPAVEQRGQRHRPSKRTARDVDAVGDRCSGAAPSGGPGGGSPPVRRPRPAPPAAARDLGAAQPLHELDR